MVASLSQMPGDLSADQVIAIAVASYLNDDPNPHLAADVLRALAEHGYRIRRDVA